jgi:hypothetical protein
MSKFDEYLAAVLNGTEKLAGDMLLDLIKESREDAKGFLATANDDLKQWTEQLSTGEITKDEFEFLVLAKKDLAQLLALKRAGLTKVKLEVFQNALMELVVDTAFKVFL